MASRFTDKTKSFIMPRILRAKRRPQSGYALATYRNEVSENKKAVVQSVFNVQGFSFVFNLSLLCKRSANIKIARNLIWRKCFSGKSGWTTMPDGSFPNFRIDPTGKIYTDLMIQKTPTLYLVSNDGSQKHMLAEGIVTMDELIDAIVTTAHNYKYSDEEHQSTLEVKQQLVVDKDAGPINNRFGAVKIESRIFIANFRK